MLSLPAVAVQAKLLAPLERTGSPAHLGAFLEGLVRGVPFLRPAVLAAIELGAGAALDFAEATMTVKVHEFGRALRAVRPDIEEAEAHTIDRAVRHTTLGAILDRSVTPSELRSELYSIVAMRPRPARERTAAKLQPASRPRPQPLTTQAETINADLLAFLRG